MIDSRVTDHLSTKAIARSVMGAMAPAVHGAPRYSSDIDIMTTSLEDNPQLGCRVVAPLGLALLKLEAGGTRDIHDLNSLAEAQKALKAWELIPAVQPHLQKLSRHGRESWDRLLALLAC